MSIDQTLGFLDFTQKFRQTKRGILANEEDRFENDAEHSYQLAIFTMYIIDTKKLKVDVGLAVRYAIVHDLEEALTGDKHIFDRRGRVDKEKRKEIAREKIQQMFSNWSDYSVLSKAYKRLGDEESRLVYGLDKVLPVLNIFMDGGRSWKNEPTTLKMLVENKRPLVKIHPAAKEIWYEIEKKLYEKELELFGKLS